MRIIIIIIIIIKIIIMMIIIIIIKIIIMIIIIIIIIVIIIIIIIIIVKPKPFIDNKATYKILFTINFTYKTIQAKHYLYYSFRLKKRRAHT